MSTVYLQTAVNGGRRHRDGRSVSSAADRDVSSGPGTQEVNPDQSAAVTAIMLMPHLPSAGGQ